MSESKMSKVSFVELKYETDEGSAGADSSQVQLYKELVGRGSLGHYDLKVYDSLMKRNTLKVIQNEKDYTPKNLVASVFSVRSSKPESNFWNFLKDTPVRTRFSEILVANKGNTDYLNIAIPDMDDLTAEPVERTDSTEYLDIETSLKHMKDEKNQHPSAKAPKRFIKLALTETEDIVLYESASLTVPKETEEAEQVLKSNTDYDYFTIGPGRNRRTSDAETQTLEILVKSRGANTERIKKFDKDSFVSNFEMFDTYADIEKQTKEITLDESDKKIRLTSYQMPGQPDIDEVLSKSENFRLSSMIVQRLLAGNVFKERQKRFKNMYLPNPLDLNVKYLYRLDTLWTYKSAETAFRDVVDMSWCPGNSDILAVAYGVYYYKESKQRNVGYVCVWSIKNPVNPERRYRYNVPVTSVEFSKLNPQLLAVALYDGTVEIIDITDNPPSDSNFAVVAKSERSTSPGFEPIWQIQWLQVKDQEFILTASQDGRIMKYTLATGPFMVGYNQLRLDRVEGIVEALKIEHKKTFIEADRHPQALCLQKHPVNPDTYLVGTDEGCLFICSINYPHQHIGVLQLHQNGGIYSIDFSPFSPKIFLTCGSDWFIRIWIEDIFEPILELSDGFGAIHSAYWSKIHSTIIASCTQNAVQIWDLRRKNLKPASVHKFESSAKPLTVIKFSECGRSLVVGDGVGNCHVCALEDMPFEPHYQYKELQTALYRSLTNREDLEKQVKQMGYLGYEDSK